MGPEGDLSFLPPGDQSSVGARRASRTAGYYLRRVVSSLSLFLILCIAWELLSRWDPSFWPRVILPPVSEISTALVEAVMSPFLWSNLWVTVQEGLIGFFIGGIAAFVLGVLIALSPAFSRAAYPLIVAFQATPHSALAPVFIAWLGFGMTSKVALVVTSCFFPVLVCTVAGLQMVGENELFLMKSLRASRFKEFYFLRLPSAMPTIFAGIQTTIVISIVAAVFSEMVASQEGAGQLIKAASFQFRLDDVFAYMIVLSLVGLALFGIVILIKRRVIAWSNASLLE